MKNITNSNTKNIKHKNIKENTKKYKDQKVLIQSQIRGKKWHWT